MTVGDGVPREIEECMLFPKDGGQHAHKAMF